ncbi:hypothetical protein Q4Q34_17420 [Flavivirga abyssicola]|uniref:hypothetical protein n=1 Tax=Flavivirga abyssicola TaxID=3063533 RepID=UPI0026DEDC1C|nr:hypothetical protein [Flavivirga sp. MEBiC07777]WVK12996.1 hypothetical protein Q4Q34_17420 [Flavivirga sp. MEBiC07777]
MKDFVFKIVIFCILFAAVYAFFVDKLSKEYVDPYYNKFSQEANGLILGLSRASEGISPEIIEEELNNCSFEKPIVNFAMNTVQSSYGEIYLRGIKKKLKPNSKNGLFIVSISPGSFTAPFGMNDKNIFDMDKEGIIGKIDNFTSAPNYSYIVSTYPLPLYNTLHDFDKWDHHKPHPSGWNEITQNGRFNKIGENDINHWKSLTIRYYKRKVEKEQFSNYRLNYFIKTIQYLKTIGNVFIVRLPADTDIIKTENDLWKGFDKQFDSISKQHDVKFLNYSSLGSDYKTYDGSHMLSTSAKKFSKLLGKDIRNSLMERNKYGK